MNPGHVPLTPPTPQVPAPAGRGSSGDPRRPKIEIEKVSLFYGTFRALQEITMPIYERQITALIGPSGCGKSTLLRCLNRMNDDIRGVRVSGQIRLDGVDILSPDCDVTALRKRVGMVFQRPNPFPLSVAENVLFGLRVAGEKRPKLLTEILEQSLRAAWMWEHVADRLHAPALHLPLDQQQRLCIARVLAVRPEVILLDEPCSALDPIATAKIEELLLELRQRYTIVIVTHNMQQASRISDYTGFLYLGDLVEFGPTADIFTNPRDPKTQAYVAGRFG